MFDRSVNRTEHRPSLPVLAKPDISRHLPAVAPLFGRNLPNASPTVMRAARCGPPPVGPKAMSIDVPLPLALRPRDAAKALGISPRLLWQLTKDGHVPCVRVGAGKRKSILYPVAELQAWLARKSVPTNGGAQ